MKKRFSAIVAIAFTLIISLCLHTTAMAECLIGAGNFEGANPMTGDNTPTIITIVVIVLIAACVAIGALVAINRRRWL